MTRTVQLTSLGYDSAARAIVREVLSDFFYALWCLSTSEPIGRDAYCVMLAAEAFKRAVVQ